MKLSDFGKKPGQIRANSPQFVLQNDTEIQKFKEQIEDLNKQLGFYRTIEAERDDAIRRMTAKEETLGLVQLTTDEFREEAVVLNNTIIDQQRQLKQLPKLEEDARNAMGKYSQTKNELNNLTTTAFEQSKTISLLGSQVQALTSDNSQLEATAKQAVAHKISAEAEFETIHRENKELKNSTEYTSKINRELREDCKTMTDKANFWAREAQESSVQIKEATLLEEKLRLWVTDLEQKESVTSTVRGNLNKEVVTLQETIKDMGATFEGLMKEMTYLRAVNKEYRKELAKPRFMSMGAIARKEGFVMPNGKENLRKHYLGNAAPTLLKFKAREETSHAR